MAMAWKAGEHVPRDRTGARAGTGLPGANADFCLEIRYLTRQIRFDKHRGVPIHYAAFANRPVRGAAPTLTSMKTFTAKSHEVKRDWFLIDASDKVLGRLASEIAKRLRGKHKVTFTPHVDTGDYIVVVNAAKLRVTGDKANQKIYYRHSTYPGGIYSASFSKLHARFPGRVLEKAVKGMLPKGPLGYAMLKKLKVYGGGDHPHAAQQPQNLNV
jgi:large subunit ribosomal protein L13